MSTSETPRDRLDGWKAIAEYLKRDQRTVQRWSKERGMPVHHVPGGRRGAVFAYPAELDGWLRAEPTGPGAAQAHDTSAGDAQVAEPEVVGAEAAEAPSDSSRRPPFRPVAVLLLAIAASVALLALTWHRAPAPVDRLELHDGTLVAYGRSGSASWSFPLPPGALDARNAPRAHLADWAAIDIDGDGALDVLAMVNYGSGRDGRGDGRFERADVYALSAQGRLRWTFVPDLSLSFAGQRFTGAWRLRSWFPDSQSGLWISYIHQIWWPSFLVHVGADGEGRLAFVNAGHIETIRLIDWEGGRHLVIGGVNNEYRSAAVAVLDPDASAASPQGPGTAFSCDECLPDRPAQYLLLPLSEVAAISGEPYNFADSIAGPDAEGMIEVSVREVPAALGPRTLYRLSSEFLPVSVAMSDRYWEMHDELWRSGKLDHSRHDCPEAHDGVIAKVWEPDTGWRELLVPPMFPQGNTASRNEAIR